MIDIKKTYQQEIANTRNSVLEFNWKDEAHYTEWLAQTYFYIEHSTRIIALACAHFPLDKQDLHNRFIDHTKEEKNHEKMLILDLKELGKTVDQFTPSFNSLALYQTQYYWIQHVNPLSVYGYFLYLEGLSIEFGPEIVKQLSKVYPEKAYKFLKLHVEEDQDHVEHHFDFVKFSTPQGLAQIDTNLRQCSFHYRGMLNDIKTVASQSKKAA